MPSLLGQSRGETIVAKIEHFLKSGNRVIDIGAGGCLISAELAKRGFTVTPIDVVNKSRVRDLSPIIYNGKKIPFGDDAFDVALLVTVLHHVRKPEELLLEAKRVAKRVIVIEDIFEDLLQKYLTFFMDSLVNMEFIGHPHTNKSDASWRSVFEKLGLTLVSATCESFWKFFKSATYYLMKNPHADVASPRPTRTT